MNAAVSIRGLTKSYSGVRALDNVDLTVGRGELFGIIGPDGAGKSTLYKIMATLLSPDSGMAEVAGLDTVAQRQQLRTRIGYMPEKFSLYPDLSVRENLNFFADLFGVRVKDNYSLIAPIFSGLERFSDRAAGKLSGGMKQKLALSCALIHRPEILLLDEPTTGVDAVSRSEFWDMLSSLGSSGMTVVVSTSYMDEATRCDRIAMMNLGHILCTGTPSELAARADGNLYDATAADMFALLTALRALPEVDGCYTFGATLHIVAGPSFNAEQVTQKLRRAGVDDARIYPAKGTIEDLFIRLSGNAQGQ